MLFRHQIVQTLISAVFVVLTGLTGLGVGKAMASAPMAHSAAPGYYRFMLGNFEVTALSDGTVALPVDKLLQGIKSSNVDKLLAEDFESSPVQTSINAFLINTGKKLVLIDTGAGNLFGPTLGNMLKNLKASGYQPDQVDDILLTHMHPDHLGGLLTNGQIAFPHATVWVNKKDADYWLNPANVAGAKKNLQGFFKGAIASIKPYREAGHFKTFTGQQSLLPGIRTEPELGHTPGHSGYLVTSNGKSLLVWGDIIHVQAVQFRHPSVTIVYDSNPNQARATRLKVLANVAKHKILVAAAHIAFPGVGHVVKAGHGYRWIPVNYTVPH